MKRRRSDYEVAIRSSFTYLQRTIGEPVNPPFVGCKVGKCDAGILVIPWTTKSKLLLLPFRGKGELLFRRVLPRVVVLHANRFDTTGAI